MFTFQNFSYIFVKTFQMNEYQLLTNRLERVKRFQKDCIGQINASYSRGHNNLAYKKFCRACDIANAILERMVNLILDKEGIK